MEINENSILAVMNPFSLLAALLLICLTAWLSVRFYQDTNDFKRSLKCYIPMLAVLDCIFIFALHIDVILTLGLDLCGIVALALISNYYFYH